MALLSAKSPLHALRRQVRMVRKQLTILVPQNEYYVQKECVVALRQLGHRVVEVGLGEKGQIGDVGATLGLLLRACVQHKPDMLLTLNYTGFDRAAWFDELVEAMGLPVAVWFVDSPFFLAMGYLAPAPSVTTFFSWDQSYVPVLKRHGVTRVFHLPLATQPDLFAPAPGFVAPKEPAWPLSFVGHSMDALVDLWRARDLGAAPTQPSAGQGPGSSASAADWAAALLTDRGKLHALVPHVGTPIDRQILRLGHASYLASKKLRVQLLSRLPGRKIHVVGNAAWHRLLPKARVWGTTLYGGQTAEVYRRSAINLNVTNLQMPDTVNQRVFDVPAAGGFLLTDRQAELGQYFALEEEVATYGCAEEFVDKAAFFARHPGLRWQFVAKAHKRLLAEHTYAHRMARLVATMRQLHAPSRAFVAAQPPRPAPAAEESPCPRAAPP